VKSLIAFFDFDGTITKKDSFLELIKFQKGKAIYLLGFILYSPVILGYKLRLFSGHRTKSLVFSFFFKNTSILEFEAKCDQFALSILPGLIRPKALNEINRLTSLGAKIVIVTASSPAWISPWSDPLHIYTIGTNFSKLDGKLTGAIEGRNCNGEEKVNRIKEKFDLSQFSEIYVYGDSSKDKPMMSLSNVHFMKPFR
jgi:HAD superfamily hydrolase (TIGR01490 family)